MATPERPRLAQWLATLLLDAGGASVAVIVGGVLLLAYDASPPLRRLLSVLIPILAARVALNLFSARVRVRRGNA